MPAARWRRAGSQHVGARRPGAAATRGRSAPAAPASWLAAHLGQAFVPVDVPAGPLLLVAARVVPWRARPASLPAVAVRWLAGQAGQRGVQHRLLQQALRLVPGAARHLLAALLQAQHVVHKLGHGRAAVLAWQAGRVSSRARRPCPAAKRSVQLPAAAAAAVAAAAAAGTKAGAASTACRRHHLVGLLVPVFHLGGRASLLGGLRRHPLEQVAQAVPVVCEVGVGRVHNVLQPACVAEGLQLRLVNAQQGAHQVEGAPALCAGSRREGSGGGRLRSVWQGLGRARAAAPKRQGTAARRQAGRRRAVHLLLALRRVPNGVGTTGAMQARPWMPLACTRRRRKVSTWSSAWCPTSRWVRPSSLHAPRSSAYRASRAAAILASSRGGPASPQSTVRTRDCRPRPSARRATVCASSVLSGRRRWSTTSATGSCGKGARGAGGLGQATNPPVRAGSSGRQGLRAGTRCWVRAGHRAPRRGLWRPPTGGARATAPSGLPAQDCLVPRTAPQLACCSPSPPHKPAGQR